MSFVARVTGLIASPGFAWRDIAAEGDTRRYLLRVYMPLLVASPWAATALAGLLLGSEPTTAEVIYQATAADGGRVVVGAGTRQSFGTFWTGLLMVPVSLGIAAAAVFLLRDLVLRAAPRFGVEADATAATKLVVYGLTGFWLGCLFMPVPLLGPVLAMAGGLHALWLLHRGAPVLLKPVPAQAGALARAVVLRALLVGIVTSLGAAVLALLLAVMIMPHLRG